MASSNHHNTALTGEDMYGASQRGEETSRMESRLESAMEGLHAEDNPELTATIKSAQDAEDAQKGEWLAARADASVERMQGTPDVDKLVPKVGENDIDALRKLRLAQIKGAAQQRGAYLAMGHGAYAQLETESEFLLALPKHPRLVCAVCRGGSIDAELLHAHMRSLAAVHVETRFCWLDAEAAPTMMQMVDFARLPALLLAVGGKIVHQLYGVDRSFTTEGVAYELSVHSLVDFEEGAHYSKSKGGCTTASASRADAYRADAMRRLIDDGSSDDDEGDLSD